MDVMSLVKFLEDEWQVHYVMDERYLTTKESKKYMYDGQYRQGVEGWRTYVEAQFCILNIADQITDNVILQFELTMEELKYGLLEGDSITYSNNSKFMEKSVWKFNVYSR